MRTDGSSATANDEMIRTFLRAWERRNTDYIVDRFADDGVYHVMPLTPIVGKEALRAWVAKRADVPGPRIVVHHQIAVDNIVMNERTDHLTLNGRSVILPICAVFEIENGRIKSWREYCDLAPAKAAYEEA